MVFPGARVACFVDGDRWHGNGWKVRGFASFDDEFAHENSDFWKKKITRNIERDREVNEALGRAGWIVVRAWASEVERDVESVADRIEVLVRGRRSGGRR